MKKNCGKIEVKAASGSVTVTHVAADAGIFTGAETPPYPSGVPGVRIGRGIFTTPLANVLISSGSMANRSSANQYGIPVLSTNPKLKGATT